MRKNWKVGKVTLCLIIFPRRNHTRLTWLLSQRHLLSPFHPTNCSPLLWLSCSSCPQLNSCTHICLFKSDPWLICWNRPCPHPHQEEEEVNLNSNNNSNNRLLLPRTPTWRRFTLGGLFGASSFCRVFWVKDVLRLDQVLAIKKVSLDRSSILLFKLFLV